MVSDGIVVLKNINEYREYCTKYNCKNLRDLDELLWYNYGVILEIDNQLNNFIKSNENIL